MLVKKAHFLLVLASLVIFLFFHLLGFSLYLKLLFLMSYFWNYALKAPLIREKYTSDRFRYSFIGLFVRFDENLKLFLSDKIFIKDFLRRSFSPFVFVLFLSFFQEPFSLYPLLISILGSGLFEFLVQLPFLQNCE